MPKKHPRRIPKYAPSSTRSIEWTPPADWGEVGPSGWGVDNTEWGIAPATDWALEAYTTDKIQAWIADVAASSSHDPTDGGSTTPRPITQPTPRPPPTRPIHSNLYRWALNFLNRGDVSAHRKRQALGFLSQTREQQLQCIRRLIDEISRL